MNRGILMVAWRAAAVTLATVAALVAALAVGGPFASAITAECLAALALVVVLSRPPSFDSKAAGADLRTLTRIVVFFLMIRPPPLSTLFPFTTPSRSSTGRC